MEANKEKSIKEKEAEQTEERFFANIANAGLQTSERGVKQTIGNCIKALCYDENFSGNIRYNIFTGKIDIVKGAYWKRDSIELSDTDFDNILLYMEQNYGLMNKDKILSAINIISKQNEYHPIREILNSLKPRPGKYIENLFPIYLGVEKSQYCTEVTKIFMLGAIKRVFVPGCKFDTMLCLVGGQGIGKSTMFRFMAIKDEWFTDNLKRISDEKYFEKLMGHWIIEMSEMLAISSSSSIEELKAFLTRQQDSYRMPYSRYAKNNPRQCIFCGTTNDNSFLPDDKTGNRRFLPIVANQQAVIHPLDNEKETREFIMSAWAEAMEIYKSGEYSTILSEGLNDYLKKLQSDLMPEDTRVGVIQEWLDNYKGNRVCSLMIYREAFGNFYDEPSRSDIKAINEIMNLRIEGWKKSTDHRFGGTYGRQRSWERVCLPECETEFENIDDICEQEELPFL